MDPQGMWGRAYQEAGWGVLGTADVSGGTCEGVVVTFKSGRGEGTLSLENTPRGALDSQITTKWSHLRLQKSRESSGEASGCVSSCEQRASTGHGGGR